jgi:superfamily II DNA or RNA helicase
MRDADPEISLRPYQAAALEAWELAGRRGVVVLPTGSGKTHLGLAAAARTSSALCLVPTRILLGQWYASFRAAGFDRVGRLGDGEHVIEDVTVSTFESAWRRAPELGDRFELLIADEAHHFGAGIRDEVLELSVAPARLGLTATPVEGRAAERLTELIGTSVYELAIADLRGLYLADFELLTMTLELTPDERARYDVNLARFREWRATHARLARGSTWADLARLASRTDEGRRALRSLAEARRIVGFPAAKRQAVGTLLARHRDARVLVFTSDNDTAYAIARERLIMCITCEIRRAEREHALELFRRGELRALVSARVLNEGIDVPDADVAIVVGGDGGAREHVQRVGRVLRPGAGKRAIVYELVMRNTLEARSASVRRRALGAP